MNNDPNDVIQQLRSLDLSKLHFFSYGVVVEDNVDNDKIIKVYPVEKLYTKGGDLAKEDESVLKKIKERKVKHTGEYKPDYEPSLEDITLVATKFLYVEWIKDNNRITPPNVCKGEYVLIYRFSNRDEYYWKEINTDLSLRKEDHVVYTFSDKPTLDESEDEMDDRYTITISPKNKEISIHTTDKYGELTTYDITLKTDEGYLEILDGKKNSIKLNSAKDSLHAHIEGTAAKYDYGIYGDEGYVELKDDNGNFTKLDSTNDTLTANILKDVKVQAGGNITLTSGKSINLTTNIINMKCSALNIQSDATLFSGGTIKHDDISIDKTHVHTGNLGYDTSVPSN